MKRHFVFLAYNLRKGGSEKIIANLCNDYFAAKYQVTVITCQRCQDEYPLREGIHREYLDELSEQAGESKSKRFYRRKTVLLAITQRLRPDVMISFLPEPNMIACSIRSKLPCPLIISIRNNPVVEEKSLLRKMMMRYLYPRADGYVFQTQKAADYFAPSKHIRMRACVIPNPLAGEFIGLSKAQERTKRIVTVGRLEAQKNHGLLIHAYEMMHHTVPEYTLEIYGDGQLFDALKEEIADLGLNPYVKLKGVTADVRAAICDASLFVLSSDYEGMPNALMEAMAMGIPVVSTDCPSGGPAYLIRDGINGLMVPVRDVETLAVAMQRLLEDREYAESLADEGMKSLDQLHPDIISRKWEEYILQTMSEA